MAGQEIVKSTKSSFLNVSPKPKQASILNFFGSKTQQPPNSSPLSKVVQNTLPIARNCDLKDDMDDFPTELFDEPFEFSVKESKKPCIPQNPIIFTAKIGNGSAVIAPRILNELNDAAETDFDQSEASCGRYQWLIDLKDINGHKKGTKYFIVFLILF